MNKKVELEDDFASKRTIDAHRREISKIAHRPSKRQQMLTSKKADKIAGNPDLIYRGEDLKRRPR